MRAPVEFQNLPAGLELVGNPPDTVEVRLRGSSGALSRMAGGDMAAVIDLATARPGRRLFHIAQNQVTVPYGIEIVQVGPSTLTMEFEMSAIRQVKVEPDIEGRPAAGYEVTKVTSDPDTGRSGRTGERAQAIAGGDHRAGVGHRSDALGPRSGHHRGAGLEPAPAHAANRGGDRDDFSKATMKLFGTDGIRGKAGNAPLIPETVARVGAALVQAFNGDQGSGIGDRGRRTGS